MGEKPHKYVFFSCIFPQTDKNEIAIRIKKVYTIDNYEIKSGDHYEKD